MAKAPGKLGGKALTDELRKLAVEVHTVTDDGTPVTREQALAQMIWRQALGWEEIVVDDNGNRKKIPHLPVAWCQQFLFERTEGKSAIAAPEEGTRISAAEKVRDLSKQRLNKMAAISAMPKLETRAPKKRNKFLALAEMLDACTAEGGILILETWTCEKCGVDAFSFHKFDEVLDCAKCGHRRASAVPLYRQVTEDCTDKQ